MNVQESAAVLGTLGQQALNHGGLGYSPADIQRLTAERIAAQEASNQRFARQTALDAALKTAEIGELPESVLRRASFYEDYLFPKDIKESPDGK